MTRQPTPISTMISRWTSSSRTRLGAFAVLAVAVVAAAAFAVLASGGGDEGVRAGGISQEDGEATSSLAVGAPAPMASAAVTESKADDGFFPAVSGTPSLYGDDGALDLLGRQIIRNGSLDIEVESVVDAFERVTAIASAAGGFVADSTFFGREEEQNARLTLRVPGERFDAVVTELRGLAVEVLSVSTSSQDVTGEFTDLESSLRNYRAVEAQYLELLGEARNIGEILQVQDRLNQVRLQIDRTEGRIQLLQRLTDLATLSVELRPVAPALVADGGGGPLAAAQAAWEASLSTLSNIATVAVVVAVYSWWLVPLLAVAVVAARRLLNRQEGAAAID